jgi:tetratricopeptide (TPR) repeat protein
VIASATLFAWLSFFGEEPADRPYVEILESRGSIDSTEGAPGPGWQKVHVSLRVENHVPADIDRLTVLVDLVVKADKAEGRTEEPIAGWRFEQSFGEIQIPSGEEASLRIDRSLPARRRVHDPNEIAYRVTVLGYRLVPPSLDLAVKLLESSAPGDQRAALWSYERLDDLAAGPGAEDVMRREIARAIASPGKEPSAQVALRLLMALRAAGDLGHPSIVPLLLAIPERIEGARWGAALADLSARMIEASDPSEPRLEVLPALARTTNEIGSSQGEDLLVAAAREAILRLGDRAVPELVRASQLGESDKTRALATSALGALGRASVKTQLSISDRDARRRLIEVYGEIGSGEPVAALADLLAARGGDKKAVTAALERIGGAAIEPLVHALATPDKETRRAIIDVIQAIGQRGKAELLVAARRYGLRIEDSASTRAIAEKLSSHLAAGARSRWAAELRRAISLTRSQDHDEAFRILDTIYAADPELYMEHAHEIALTYVDRARQLYVRGNYDAAIDTLKIAQTIEQLPEMSGLFREIQLTLAKGYLDLDELDRAEEALASAEKVGPDSSLRELRAKVIVRRAEIAYAKREYGQARALLERAKALDPDAEATKDMNWRLRLSENVPIVLVLSLMVPGGALTVILLLRRRIQSARLARFLAKN